MDDLIMVSHTDSYRHVYEYIKDMLAYYTIPSNMKMSHVANELLKIVKPPNACVYDGLLGVSNSALEMCERIASCRENRYRSQHVDVFVPLRLEHWLVRHLVTIRLHTSGRYVAYYDPNGTSYQHETRVIVGLEHNGGPVTPGLFIELLMRSLTGWTCHSACLRHQGILSPLSCGRFNLHYICECLRKSKQRAAELALPKLICTFSSNV
jgi:hypothetical protein